MHQQNPLRLELTTACDTVHYKEKTSWSTRTIEGSAEQAKGKCDTKLDGECKTDQVKHHVSLVSCLICMVGAVKALPFFASLCLAATGAGLVGMVGFHPCFWA